MLRSPLLLSLLTGCGAAHRSAAPEDPALASAAEEPAHTNPFTAIAAFADSVADRGARLLADDPWDAPATTVRYLDQGWGPVETLWYYYANQGSRLLPRDTLLNLEAAQGTEPLATPETFARFRFLNQAPTPNNPDGLPVGFATDGDQVGLTCAACHTGQLVYEGTALRVDGAPALMDMLGFFEEIEGSLRATLADDDKFARFAAATGAAGDQEKEAATRLSLQRSLGFFETYTRNFEEVPGGYGRVDAIGGIVNQVIRFTSGTTYASQANAPASYPLLWDAPRHDYVQWTGFSTNSGIGALGRNTGEVVGVFGEIHVTGVHDASENKAGFATSVRGQTLVDLEETLWKLQSPVWPEDVLPAIDQARAERGAGIYDAQCASCHALLDRDDPKRRVTAQITGIDVVGTDPKSATNLHDARVPAGVLEGSLLPDGSRVYGQEASGLDLLTGVVGNTLKQNKAAAIRTLANAKIWGLTETPKQGDHAADTDADPVASLLSYKARPLNGAWASSPYLHNGSVPTLYDLLLPEAERPARFAVGRWTYDPVKVGYVSEGEDPWVFDTSVDGNRNTGHLYGTTLSDADRWALVEYLKTL